MVFGKICPLCKQNFFSLATFMTHIKNSHPKTPPEEFVRKEGETKWSFRNDE